MNLSGAAQASQPTAIKAIKIQTSTYGAVIPLVYGTARITGNLIGYYDFSAIANSSNTGK